MSQQGYSMHHHTILQDSNESREHWPTSIAAICIITTSLDDLPRGSRDFFPSFAKWTLYFGTTTTNLDQLDLEIGSAYIACIYIMYFGDWPHIHPCPNSTDPLHKISQMVIPQSFSDLINFNMSTSQQPYPSSKRKLYQPSGFKTPT